MGWLLGPILPRNLWTSAAARKWRAITSEEHRRIVQGIVSPRCRLHNSPNDPEPEKANSYQ